MRCHEAEAFDRGPAVGRPDAVDGADELGEVRPAVEIEAATRPALGVDVCEARLRVEVVAVRIHVLAEERDLAIARRGNRARLLDDLVERPAALRAATERDDAVGARLVAAVDDRQPGAGRGSAGDSAGGDGLRTGLGQVIGDADERSTDDRRRSREPDRRLGRRETQPIDELWLLVGAQEQVDGRIALLQAGPIRLAHGAAGHDDTQCGICGFQAGEMALPADHLLLGGLADGAGVDHDEVRPLEVRGLFAARGQQSAGHLFGVAPVHLAAERPDVEPRERPRLWAVLVQAGVVGAYLLAGSMRRTRAEFRIEHRQLAERHCPIASWRRSTTVGGTFSVAWASAYVMRSPW